MSHGLDTDATVFFYEQEFYPLSNFSAFTLMWRGYRLDTSEAAYHWEKFPPDTLRRMTGRESPRQEAIRLAPSAHEAFRLGQAKDGRRDDWDDVKIDVMRKILRAKVAQHAYVLRKLRKTGERQLIENSWRDAFWGWGPNRDGQNMLGKLWMEIRESLRADPALIVSLNPAAPPAKTTTRQGVRDLGSASHPRRICPRSSTGRHHAAPHGVIGNGHHCVWCGEELS
jgi:ribA/ribD-fused uncharacterized protein